MDDYGGEFHHNDTTTTTDGKTTVFNIPMGRDKLRHQVHQVHRGSDTRDSQEVAEVNGGLKLFLPQRHDDTMTR